MYKLESIELPSVVQIFTKEEVTGIVKYERKEMREICVQIGSGICSENQMLDFVAWL